MWVLMSAGGGSELKRSRRKFSKGIIQASELVTLSLCELIWYNVSYGKYDEFLFLFACLFVCVCVFFVVVFSCSTLCVHCDYLRAGIPV